MVNNCIFLRLGRHKRLTTISLKSSSSPPYLNLTNCDKPWFPLLQASDFTDIGDWPQLGGASGTAAGLPAPASEGPPAPVAPAPVLQEKPPAHSGSNKVTTLKFTLVYTSNTASSGRRGKIRHLLGEATPEAEPAMDGDRRRSTGQGCLEKLLRGNGSPMTNNSAVGRALGGDLAGVPLFTG